VGVIIAAGLFIGTFRNLTRVSTGYDTDHIVIMHLNLQRAAADASGLM
jgi:hypothetical protein